MEWDTSGDDEILTPDDDRHVVLMAGVMTPLGPVMSCLTAVFIVSD